MVDYALMNQHLYEGNAKAVEQMTIDAQAEGRRPAASTNGDWRSKLHYALGCGDTGKP